MTQLYTIHWQSPHGKQITSRALTEAQARAEIENNQRHTPNWMYTVQPPLPDLQAMLDTANKRIAELEAVCREVVTALELEQIEDDIRFAIPYMSGFKTHYDLQGDDYEGLFDAFAHLLDILPPAE